MYIYLDISKNIKRRSTLFTRTIRLLYHSSKWGVWLNMDKFSCRCCRHHSLFDATSLIWTHVCVTYSKCTMFEAENEPFSLSLSHWLHVCRGMKVNTHMLNLIRYTVLLLWCARRWTTTTIVICLFIKKDQLWFTCIKGIVWTLHKRFAINQLILRSKCFFFFFSPCCF